MLKKVTVILVLFIGFVTWWQDRPVAHSFGVIAPNIPVQTKTTTAPFRYKDYILTPLANFQLEARVLAKENYYLGREAELSPVDLAFGWGPMSDEKVLEHLSISQSNRFYYWSTRKFPIPRRQIETNSANMHLIPANDDIKKRLKSVREGQVVRLQGYLIRAQAGNGWNWQTSLTRKDVGAGACELIWVEQLSIL